MDSGLSTSELSNNIFEKRSQIIGEAIRRYLVSQNYKYQNPQILTFI